MTPGKLRLVAPEPGALQNGVYRGLVGRVGHALDFADGLDSRECTAIFRRMIPGTDFGAPDICLQSGLLSSGQCQSRETSDFRNFTQDRMQSRPVARPQKR